MLFTYDCFMSNLLCFLRCVPEVFEEQIVEASFGHTVRRNSRVQAEVASLSHGGRELLDIVVASVHNIAPNVLLAKREVRNVVLCVVSMPGMKKIFPLSYTKLICVGGCQT